MKKKSTLLTLLFITMAFVLSGCAANPKNFTVGDLTITLNDDFKELNRSDIAGFDVYIESDNIAFSAVRETQSELEYAGYEIASLNDYCMQIAELNGVNASELIQRGSYFYFINSNVVSGASYTYVHCMFKSANTYWICEFVCKTKSFDRNKEQIFQWADSIEIAR